jgi:hypothetical protein
MESTRSIGDTNEVSCMKDRLAEEGEHTRISRWPSQFHEVIDQRITSTPLSMQESAGEIKPRRGERHPHLTL